MADFPGLSPTPDSTDQILVEAQEKAGGSDCGRERIERWVPNPDKADANSPLACEMDEVRQRTYD